MQKDEEINLCRMGIDIKGSYMYGSPGSGSFILDNFKEKHLSWIYFITLLI